ncbi:MULTISPECIES: hypothetical protein [Capnocytophaga]|uniref:Uncharacterized protein n=1 Tax=Capnocytophaga canis TaxID=1848903 RepID=A0A0B7IMF1_9FLAO|nr:MULTISPECIES: hypothetical protein [Capnocytophaga]GJQ04039.1 hypothetical protein CAPN009_04540 [Capnocytophaga canimorsus]CEN53050.1 hypothetical protein CCAND93_350026 [Capnocytophaga canis]
MKKGIKEEITLLPNENLTDKGMLSPDVRKYILDSNKDVIIVNGEEKSFSINALRIVLTLCLNLKERQLKFRSKDKDYQLSLFDNEWFSIDNNESMSVQINFKFSDFLPKGSKNYDLVRKGINELQERIYTIEFERENSKGEKTKYRLRSALISQYVEEEKKGFKFVINNFWYRALLNVSQYYTPMIKKTIFSLSHNAMIFYIYLNGLPKIKDQKDSAKYDLDKVFNVDNLPLLRGTIINKYKFQEMFKTTYKYDSKIKEKLLDPFRKELNKVDISFNYKFEGDNIVLVAYEMLSNQVKLEITSKEEVDIEKAVAYRFVKKELSPTQAMLLCEIYLKYTYDIVTKATSRSSKIRNLKGEEFINTFVKIVEDYVTRNKINLNDIEYSNKQELRKKITKKYYNRMNEITPTK